MTVKSYADEKRRLGWIWQKNNRTQTSIEPEEKKEENQIERQIKKQQKVKRCVVNSRTKKIVILDVGGDRFTALRSTLHRFPTTRLGRLVRANTIEKILENCDEFFPGDPPE